MRIGRTRNAVSGALCAVAMLVVLGPAQAAVRVGGSSLRANGQVVPDFVYAGHCPVSLKFGWGLTGSGPATLAYSFVRSDGGHFSSVKGGNILGANQSLPVYYDWRIGALTPQFANFRGWVELKVHAPNRLVSRIHFTLHCQ